MPVSIVDAETRVIFDKLTAVVEESEDMIAITTAVLLILANLIVAKSKTNNIPSQTYFQDHGQYLASLIQAIETDMKEMNISYAALSGQWKM